MNFTLPELLERISSCDGTMPHETDLGSLLHAYIACLSFADLCTGIAMTLNDPVGPGLALRSRLLRLLREECSDMETGSLAALIDQTLAAGDTDKAPRRAADALHSAMFPCLPLPTQRMLLDRWVDRG